MVHHFKKRQKGGDWQRKAIFIGVGIIMAALVVVILIADVNMYRKKQELHYQVSSLNEKIAEIKKSNASLEQGIAEADNETYIEKVAREQLGLQKPGEKVVSFVPAAPTAAGAALPAQPFWQAWLGAITHWFK